VNINQSDCGIILATAVDNLPGIKKVKKGISDEKLVSCMRHNLPRKQKKSYEIFITL
jgi:hypothetical protein